MMTVAHFHMQLPYLSHLIQFESSKNLYSRETSKNINGEISLTYREKKENQQHGINRQEQRYKCRISRNCVFVRVLCISTVNELKIGGLGETVSTRHTRQKALMQPEECLLQPHFHFPLRAGYIYM